MRGLSIIIPHLNHSERLNLLLKALVAQSDTHNLPIEICVVDNGSLKSIENIVAHPAIKIIEFSEEKNPYICRNIGVRNTSMPNILFVDATCVPDSQFLLSLNTCFSSGHKQIILGELKFQFPKNPSTYHLADALLFMPNTENAPKGSAPVFACMLTREDFDLVGEFREDMRSGADLEWTGRAVKNGMELKSCPEAIVFYPSRGFMGLMRKAYRIGNGHRRIAKLGEGFSGVDWILKSFWTMRPMLPHNFNNLTHTRLKGQRIPSYIRLYIAAWLFSIVKGLGKLGILPSLSD